MLKGWSSIGLNSQVTAPLLGALIISTACLSSVDATEMDAQEFAEDVRGKALSVEGVPFEAVAHVFEDGSMDVQSAIGTWHGSWATYGETMCLFFDDGPQMGETCVTIQRLASGGYQTSDGTRLIPVANALRF